MDKKTEDKNENKKKEIELDNDNQIEKLKIKLEICQKTLREYLEGWKRERAEFINYKKEESERKEKIIKFANKELILKLLEVLDNFEIAKKNLSLELKEDEWVKGVLRIYQRLVNILRQENVKEIKTVGEKFDPHFHEALEEVKMKGRKTGEIVEEIRKGYMIDSEVIRPARVKIAK